jgi:phage gp36-like protein
VTVLTQAHLEARLSVETVKQIYDDNNDGSPDSDPIAQLLADAQSYVFEAIEDLYTEDSDWPLTAPYPSAVIRLCLDAAEAYAAKRHPEYVRRDWQALFAHLDIQLDRLRELKRSLGQDPPGPPDDGITVYTDIRRGW